MLVCSRFARLLPALALARSLALALTRSLARSLALAGARWRSLTLADTVLQLPQLDKPLPRFIPTIRNSQNSVGRNADKVDQSQAGDRAVGMVVQRCEPAGRVVEDV